MQKFKKMIRKAKSMALAPSPWPWICRPWRSTEHVRSFSAHGRKERLTPHFVENHTHWKPQAEKNKRGQGRWQSKQQCFIVVPCYWERVEKAQPVCHWEAPARGTRSILLISAHARQTSDAHTAWRNVGTSRQSWSFSKLDIKHASPASAVSVSGFVLHLLKDGIQPCISLGKLPAPTFLASGISVERAVPRETGWWSWSRSAASAFCYNFHILPFFVFCSCCLGWQEPICKTKEQQSSDAKQCAHAFTVIDRLHVSLI